MDLVRKIPLFENLLRQISRKLRARKSEPRSFPGSAEYWEGRYSAARTSGEGSYGKFAEFKADVINTFIAAHGIGSVIEFGCGDGNQLTLADYPTYIGFDISETALARCRKLFSKDPNKSFRLMANYVNEKADIALSLDVIYHLVEDQVFANYMRTLFEASDRYVIIYSSDSDRNEGFTGRHIRHRNFTRWVEQNLPRWRLIKHIPNAYPFKGDHGQGSVAQFFIYER